MLTLCLDITLSKTLFSHIITLLLHSSKKCKKCLPNAPFTIECHVCLLNTPRKVLGLNSVINALLVTFWLLEFNQTLNNVYGDSEHSFIWTRCWKSPFTSWLPKIDWTHVNNNFWLTMIRNLYMKRNTIKLTRSEIGWRCKYCIWTNVSFTMYIDGKN